MEHLIVLNKYGTIFYNERTEKSFTEFYNNAYPIFKSFIKRRFNIIDKDKIGLILSYTFEWIWFKIDKYDPKRGSFSTWSHFACMNSFYKVYEINKNVPKVYYFDTVWLGNSIDINYYEYKRDKYDDYDLFKLVEDVYQLERVSELHKEIFINKYIHDMTYIKLSKKYNVGIDTLKSTCYRIKLYLRRGYGPVQRGPKGKKLIFDLQ